MFEPSDNGNLLWQKERQNQIKLLPSRVTPTPLEGVSLYTDVEKGTWGKISDIGGGQYLITESGPDQDKLTIMRKDPDGGLTWR